MTAPATTTARPSRRRALVPLATLLAAASLAMASGATFNASTANPANRYETGTLTMDNSRGSGSIFTRTNLKPGDSVTGQVTITNSGTLPAIFTLAETTQVNTFADPDLLNLRITQGDTVVYDGQLGELGSIPLGTWNALEARTFTFTATLDASADNDNQNSAFETTYGWASVQTAGEQLPTS